MSIAASVLLTLLTFAPPAVDAAPACTHHLRVALTQPYSPVLTALRASRLLFTATISGAGVGTNIGVLDTMTGNTAWLTTFVQYVEQRPVFLTDDMVVYQKFPLSGGYEMHAIWFGADGQPGSADDATWMFENGNAYVSWLDSNDDEVAWLVTDTVTGLTDLHRCDWRSGTPSPCVPGGVVVLPLPTVPFTARAAHPIGASEVLIRTFGSNAVSWVDPAGTLVPWQNTYVVDAVGPFVATWRNPPGLTEIELATNPPGIPMWSVPISSASLSRTLGSNGGARMIGSAVGGFIAPGVVVDLDLGGGYTTLPTSYVLGYTPVVEGDRIAYVTHTASSREIEVEDCRFL